MLNSASKYLRANVSRFRTIAFPRRSIACMAPSSFIASDNLTAMPPAATQSQGSAPHDFGGLRRTTILSIDPAKIGRIVPSYDSKPLIEDFRINWNHSSSDFENLRRAASQLQDTDIPVAFPTETVYGLGADATRSSAVQGIYKAKQRPSDNPLIVHFSSLQQLRSILGASVDNDPIPSIYKPLIERFWPGPLTIILPNPKNTRLAPEVTAGLQTFGARIPKNLLALALIKLAGVPLAAPSANASTKPSPTAAEHVKHDLDGRIEIIIDGGPCSVGLESTVVDGLSNPPAILRPGGVSLEELQSCPGWENVVVGYKDVPENGIKPRAPGMKYRHYSPKATVVLYEAGAGHPTANAIKSRLKNGRSVGLIRTKYWQSMCGLPLCIDTDPQRHINGGLEAHKSLPLRGATLGSNPFEEHSEPPVDSLLRSFDHRPVPTPQLAKVQLDGSTIGELWEISLGGDTKDVAKYIFSALRELDRREVEAIFVEGIGDNGGDIATAVMNRLRKAAGARIIS